MLALAGLLVQRKKAVEFFRRHTHIVVAAVVLLVLDAVASMGNTVTFGGRTLFTVPIPQVLMDFWAMFSSCARLAWLAGMLLAVAACGLVLRFWNGAAAAVLLLSAPPPRALACVPSLPSVTPPTTMPLITRTPPN